MKSVPPKAAVLKRELSVTLDQALLQDVDDLAALLRGATDRAYIVGQALRRTIAGHEALQQRGGRRTHANA